MEKSNKKGIPELEQVFALITENMEKKWSYNKTYKGQEYVPFPMETSTWEVQEESGYSDKTLRIPYSCFMTVEGCQTLGDGKYRLNTYTPCCLPLSRKCLAILGQEEDTELHRHEYYEMIYVYQGKRTMQIEEQEVVLRENEFCIFDMKCAHKDLRMKSEGIAFYCCMTRKMVDNYFLDHIQSKILRHFFLLENEMKSDVSYFRLRNEENAELIEKYLANIFMELEGETIGYERLVQVYILRILNSHHELQPSDMFVFPKKLRGTKLFQSVARYISSNIADISLQMLCEEFHYQTDYYNRLIKKHTGLTYSDYIQSVRIEKAKNLLLNTDLSVQKIMMVVGYRYHSHFYATFKKETGETPFDYRQHWTKIKGIKKS